MSTTLPEVCNRTRQHVSLRLDTELSELEEALVAAHLARCAACSAFAHDAQAFTDTLRSAPLAEPSMQFELPRRPARFSVASVGSAAAAAITVAIALSGLAVSGVGDVGSRHTRISAADVQLAHERLILQELLTESMESTAAEPAREVPRGVRAAEEAIVGSTQGG